MIGRSSATRVSPLQEHGMRPLRYSINLTLDGRCDHRAISPDEELHRHHARNLEQADALLFGRVTYEMMEAGWRPVAQAGVRPDWMPAWMEPFARTIDAARKYVVSSTLGRVDWNAELVRGDLGEAVRRLKGEPGKGLLAHEAKVLLLPRLERRRAASHDQEKTYTRPRRASLSSTTFAS